MLYWILPKGSSDVICEWWKCTSKCDEKSTEYPILSKRIIVDIISSLVPQIDNSAITPILMLNVAHAIRIQFRIDGINMIVDKMDANPEF